MKTHVLLFIVVLNTFVDGDLLRMPPEVDNKNRPIPGPLQMRMGISIKAIHDYNVETSQVTLETEISLYWRDLRVSAPLDFTKDVYNDSDGTYIALSGEFASKIWMPDLQIDMAVSIRNPQYLNDASSFRIYQDGRIKYSTLLNYDVFCHMNFMLYPFDTQVCPIGFESFDFSTKNLWLSWKEEKFNEETLDVQRFNCKVDYENTVYKLGDAEYTKINMIVTLERKFFFFFVSIFIPSSLCLTVTYLSFYSSPTDHATRMPITGANLPIILALMMYAYADAPDVGYTVYIDWWLYPILIFNWVCLYEFILIQYLIERGNSSHAKNIEFASRFFFFLLAACYSLGYWIFIAIYGWGLGGDEVKVDLEAFEDLQE